MSVVTVRRNSRSTSNNTRSKRAMSLTAAMRPEAGRAAGVGAAVSVLIEVGKAGDAAKFLADAAAFAR
jgi:hypothetical protein